jgi:anti-sigma regulatory factor (Ser/Thr protein kinase)
MSARLRIELEAVPERVPKARGAITRLCEHLEVTDEVARNVRLAVTEACSNCVLHAYDGEAALTATFAVEARVEDDALLVVVRDSGVGLRSDRTGKTGLGLGLRLMREAASSVDISSSPGRGTRVAMRFALR